MHSDLHTYTLLHDFSTGHWLGASDTPSGYLASLPDELWAGNSFELSVDCYELYSDTSPVRSDFPADAYVTATLYIKFADMEDTPAQLATGTITTDGTHTERNRITFQVAAAALSAAYAGTNRCLIYFEVDGASPYEMQRSAAQKLNIIDEDGDTTNNPLASQIAYTPYDASDWTDPDPDDVAEALDDLADSRADKTGSSDIEITDSSAGWILRNAAGERRRVTVDNSGLLTVSDPL